MKPMLAATLEKIEHLEGRYPLLASPKLDGIRALVQGSKLVSRNIKPIPNAFVQRELPYVRLGGLDGELVVGNAYDKDCFCKTSSGVMSVDGNPDFTYFVFDRVIEVGYGSRLAGLRDMVSREKNKRLKVVPQVLVEDAFQLYEYEQTMLEKGFEGVMLRNPDGAYKFGRSTLKEGHLLKLKRFGDSEAAVIGFEELEHNENEKTLMSGGKAKRSSHKAGMVPMGILGTMLVRDIHTGVEFGIGSGFTQADREIFWSVRESLLKKVVKYKFFPTGSKDKPRFPVFLGFRDPIDL